MKKTLAQQFADKKIIREIMQDIYECKCFYCKKIAIIVENKKGGPTLQTLQEEGGWTFPVLDEKKICLCPTCSSN